MKINPEKRNQAQELRRQGLSYSEIRSLMPDVAKSTLNNWLKGIIITSEQQDRLIEKM